MENTLFKNFKAAVLIKQNTPLSILRVGRVQPSFGQVEVKMISAALCGAQWNEITGVKGTDKFLPHMMGHEGFGKVLSIGDGVTKVKPGDFVVLHWRKGSGHDCFGPKFKSNDVGEIGSGSVTTFSEYTVVAENRVTAVNYSSDFKYIYPLIGCALSTSWGLITKELNAKKDNSIFICGAGGLGTSIALWASIFQLKKIVVFDRAESKRNYVEKLGGAFYSVENNDKIEDLKENFDFAVDTTGNVENISACFDRVGKKGALVLVGQPRIGSVLKLNNPLRLFDGIRIFSSDGGSFYPDDDISIILNLLMNNKNLLDLLISHIINIENINEGFRLMQTGEAIRVAINFEGEVK